MPAGRARTTTILALTTASMVRMVVMVSMRTISKTNTEKEDVHEVDVETMTTTTMMMNMIMWMLNGIENGKTILLGEREEPCLLVADVETQKEN
mmetsp:Transcript_86449/g.249701  ORF Transcript_86449/g.249701 Transcript_86449/m.249701 type:complete len:94 (+) Transcript_86449:2294-2575(+)